MFAINKKPSNLLYQNVELQKASDDFQKIIAKVRQVMAVPNQAAYIAMMSAYDKLKETPFYKHRVKKELNDALKAFNEFDKALHYGTYNDRDFFNPAPLTPEEIEQGLPQLTREDVYEHYFTIGGMAYKRYAEKLETLRLHILKCFNDIQMPYAEEMSCVCIGNSVLEHSTYIFDRLMIEYKKMYGIDFASTFSPFRMTKVHYHFNKAAYYLALKTTKPGEEIDLNTKENIKQAFEDFELSILKDLESCSSAIEAALDDEHLFSEGQLEEFKKYAKEHETELQQNDFSE